MAWDKDAANAATNMAEKELDEIRSKKGSAEDVLVWWKKWYNGASGQHPTGHKALGRLLVKKAGETV